MNIVIAGDGEVGFHLAEMLSKENHNITVIGANHELLTMLESNNDISAITGDPCSPSVLLAANIRSSDLYIAVAHDERPNILSCILSKKLGAKKTIARINNVEFLDSSSMDFFKNLGVDSIVSPERIAAEEVYELLMRTEATEVLSFDNGLLQLLQIRLTKHSELLGQKLSDVSKKYRKIEFRAVAIMRNNKTFIPTGEEMFMENDFVYVISTQYGLKEVFKLGHKKHVAIRNLMIAGASRIGRRTALQFEENSNVKLIEKSKQRCLEFSGDFKNALIINGDATDIDILHDEGLTQMDAFVAATNNSETNILTCLHAKRAGVPKTIALVENIDYITISQSVGIDAIVNKKLIAASHIARFTMNAAVANSKMLNGIDAEVFEFIVAENSIITQKPIYQLNFPKDAIIAGIIRDGQSYITLGHFRIMAKDRVVVLSLPENVNDLPHFFN